MRSRPAREHPGTKSQFHPNGLASVSMVMCVLAFYVLTQYSSDWHVPFVNEDWAFLDVTRRHSFFALWSPTSPLAGPWFRPLSQGLHYWLMQRLVGTNVVWWHIASAALLLVVLSSYFSLVRRLAGVREAGIATAGAAALAAWGVLLTWIAGVQDLWMLAFAMGYLHAVMSDQRLLGLAFLAAALLSKEVAAVLPALAVLWHLLVGRRGLREAWLRTWPMWLCVLMWAIVHPSIGLAHVASTATPDRLGTMRLAGMVMNAALAIVNLDVRPAPIGGWIPAAVLGLLGLPALVGLQLWCSRNHARIRAGSLFENASETFSETKFPRGRVALFGVCWTILGWAPLLQPSLNWHSYYSVFGSLGAWLAIGVHFVRWPRWVASVILVLALLRAGRSMTVIHDWGEESYVRRAGLMLNELRRDLQTKVPTPAANSRFFFHRVPSEVGFLVGDGPQLRVWYDDPTLRGGLWREFRRREPLEELGSDRFFRYDSLAGWVEVVSGPEDVAASRVQNLNWNEDHERLARTLTYGEDWGAAFREYTKLAEAVPDEPTFPFMAGLAALALGDSVGAETWIGRAAGHPSADGEIRAAAISMGIRVSPR